MAAAGGAVGARGQSYTDTDGTVMEWDPAQRGYFPKLDDAFLASYHVNYGTAAWQRLRTPEGHDYYFNSVTQETTWTRPKELGPEPAQPTWRECKTGSGQTYFFNTKTQESVWEQPEEMKAELAAQQQKIAAAASAAKGGEDTEADTAKAKADEAAAAERKRKADFFQMTSKENPNVYVEGLPSDITEDEFVEFMSKCGIIALDPTSGERKIKIYRDEEGTPKGDGRCCYYKVQSVSLALQILDGSYIKEGHKIKISRAVFEQKGDYDPSKKRQRKKTKKFTKKKPSVPLEEKLLSWHETGPKKEKSKKVASIAVFKRMFTPAEFEEDATRITELSLAVREVCSKFGQVKKVLIFDRHPLGVVSVRFADKDHAVACIAEMDGQKWGSRTITAEEWDGITDYTIEETELEREERLKKWEVYLEGDGSDGEKDGDKGDINVDMLDAK